MARPATDPTLVARALELVGQGEGVDEAARLTGVSASVIKRARRAAAAAPPSATGKPDRRPHAKVAPAPPAHPARAPRAAPAPAPSAEEALLDADGDPLDVARALLARTMGSIATLPPDSPRLNPARGEARALLKLVAALEAAKGAVETPDERERRLRREDGECRRRIERYVLEWESEAARPRAGAPHGVCVHCGAARGGP